MTEAFITHKNSLSAAHTEQLPRDAATMIIVDDSNGEAKILMGRRRLDQVFMPGMFVFPGGRVDAADQDVYSADELGEEEVLKLLHDMKGQPSKRRARAIALAAIREVFEETGIVIGHRTDAVEISPCPGWEDFFATGFRPILSPMSFFARAITPPGKPRRYDTRFFCLTARHIGVDTGQRDQELSEIGWYTISESFNLDLPLITRRILEDLSAQLAVAPLGTQSHAAHYYIPDRGRFQYEAIDVSLPVG